MWRELSCVWLRLFCRWFGVALEENFALGWRRGWFDLRVCCAGYEREKECEFEGMRQVGSGKFVLM